MATDLTVLLPDRPGTIADLGTTLGDAGINMLGACGFPCEGRGVIHIVVSDNDANMVQQLLASNAFDVTEVRQVIVVEIADQPGELGRFTRRIAAAGVNINLLYVATGTRIVLGVDDMETAQSVL